MPSDAHEEIIEDVRDLLVRTFHKRYTLLEFGVMLDAAAFGIMNGTRGERERGPAADFYVCTPDEAAFMFGEVGKMKDGKWQGWTAPDGKPARVLRIGFDRSAALLHPRHTPFERELLEALEGL